jgi:prepilin-type N-terminal cleavage/methylation domain-containing protein
MRRASGFTLIELAMVMILIGIVAASLMANFSESAQSLNTNETLQQATQYAQACAERVMATRHDQGFDWFATNTFTCGTAPSGFTYSDSTSTPKLVGDPYTGGACPSTCRDININVTSGSLSSSVYIMLADY